MLYHIVDRAAQAAAISEMLRVLRPGGSLVIVTCNPRPILFPIRAIMRLVADTPVLSKLARKIKGPSPVPYNPSRLRWYKGQLSETAKVELFNGGIASTHFNQKVSEFSFIGRLAWRFLEYCDRVMPKASCYLGNYVVIVAEK